MVKVNRKPNKNLKYDMRTLPIGKYQLEISRKALELLRQPDGSCSCLERERGRGKWMKFSD